MMKLISRPLSFGQERRLGRIKALSTRSRRTARFDHYRYLVEIYDIFRELKAQSTERETVLEIARQAKINVRRDHHPIRILIELTASTPDPKVISRWTRALEYADLRQVSSENLKRFLRKRGGIAGCAKRAANAIPLKSSLLSWDGDFDDDDDDS